MFRDDLPGGDLIRKGLADLGRREISIESLLVQIGAPRLRGAGLEIPAAIVERPEHELYFALQKIHGDEAHSRYNALIRRLVSFERALECAS
jgi:hypothetical protein